MKFSLLIIISFLSLNSSAQWDTKDARLFQEELNEWYRNPETSALSDEELETFGELNYFPVNEEFIVEAKFVKNKKAKQKMLGTSTGKSRKMIEYGTLIFQLKTTEYELVVLENTDHSNPEFADYLTIAFLDDTNGIETYGGGRYLGIRKHELENDSITLNFNLAYNPSCAYNSEYSCLIPPKKNYLPLRIEAGVKTGWKKKK